MSLLQNYVLVKVLLKTMRVETKGLMLLSWSLLFVGGRVGRWRRREGSEVARWERWEGRKVAKWEKWEGSEVTIWERWEGSKV